MSVYWQDAERHDLSVAYSSPLCSGKVSTYKAETLSFPAAQVFETGFVSTTLETWRVVIDLSIVPLYNSGNSFQHTIESVIFETIVEHNFRSAPEECKAKIWPIHPKESHSANQSRRQIATRRCNLSPSIANLQARTPAHPPPKPKVPLPKPSIQQPKPGPPHKCGPRKAETCQQRMKALAAAINKPDTGSRPRRRSHASCLIDATLGNLKTIQACQSTFGSDKYLS